jgi:uncharacterized protein
MTGGPVIDYEALAQDAMRGIVRSVLMRVVKSGLPGDHHFYIAFDTRAPGTVVSRRLKEKYPDEMTIVLQHRFWDLSVSEERFEVKLTFDGIPERLVVPFSALRVFYDPSVRFTLQFEEPQVRDASDAAGGRPREGTRGTRLISPPSDLPGPRPERRRGRKPRSERPAEANSIPTLPSSAPPPPGRTEPQPVRSEEPAAGDDPAPAQPGAKVVNLDQFRKK